MNWKRLLFIMNPTAGQKKKDYLIEIVGIFNKAGYETSVFITQSSGHASEIVKEHGSLADLIVCMGGDGTLNEVVAGVYALGLKKPVGYIPAGSTNDFAASLSIPTNPVEAAANIVSGTPKYIDVGSFGGRLFIYTASCGIFASTSYETPQEFKNLLGHFAYILNGIKDLSKVKRIHLKFHMEGQTVEGEYLFAAFCNTTSIGGVMNLDAGLVDFRDGLFELLLVKYPKDLLELNQTIGALLAKDYESGQISLYKVSSLLVENPEQTDWSLDGEKEVGRELTDFRVLHDIIQIIY